MKNALPPGSALVAYLRDSGGDEQELSTDQQARAVQDWCSERGYILSHVFTDQARAGSSIEKRDAFHAMIRYFRSKPPEAGLVIWDYKRFARNSTHAQFYRAELRMLGYEIISINDNVPDGPMGRFMEAAIDWKNEVFLEELSYDVKRGLSELVTVYGCVPGTPPRGFMREPVEIGTHRNGKPRIGHRWVPDPDVTPLVHRAFEMKAAGESLASIQEATNLYGSLNSYRTFFTNKLYIGILEFGDQVIEDYCEPVVDRTLWDAVQAKLKASKHRMAGESKDHPRRYNSPYLLSGLAYCAKCGSPLYGLTSGQKKGLSYERYHCTRAKRRRDCDAKPIPRKFLEQLVIEDIRQVLAVDYLQAIQERLAASRTGELEQMEAEAAALRQELGGLRRQINRTVDLLVDGSSRALMRKLQDLEAQEAGLQSRLTILEERLQSEPRELTAAEIQSAIDDIGELIETDDDELLRSLFRGLIDQVVVERDGRAVRGYIRYWFPDYASTPLIPVGAPLYKRSFQRQFSVKYRPWHS